MRWADYARRAAAACSACRNIAIKSVSALREAVSRQ